MTKEEFTAVVDRWYDPLYRFALSLCSNSEDALDLTQNAFQKLARNQEKIRDLSKSKSWLFSVLHREFIDNYRHAKRFPKTQFDTAPLPPDEQSKQTAERQIDASLALEALAQLDERFRAPITLFYLQDFSYKEISETLELPIGTVMSRLRRAKDQLRQILESPKKNTSSAPVPFPRKAQENG
ncbi:RNA polymerase sigma factor [Pelagicoccus mobilis]|uniref:RNA polymerase sigma factor n=1 Tax=Pelagicoccus mobilis TaxID=415221 RepID=A0A934RYR3_9BACT|nr:RNA polymerase sigma factor [Pelagicoccus mobilis]MBK1877321.1 RNA polymerase sigma factor [Pelagicoccus mobilis]